MDIIERIIEKEYRMFDKVNEGGSRASCQDDKETFYAMRRCQFAAWNEEMRESYLEDLTCAEEDGFNLITEKYARMMKYTAPEEYAEMEPFLRPVTCEKKRWWSRFMGFLWTGAASCVTSIPISPLAAQPGRR